MSLRWRLAHIADFLTETRNWTWLGIEPPSVVGTGQSSTSAGALAVLTEAFGRWRALLTNPDVGLSVQVGPPAGPYGQGPRRSFVLHIADELIHHAAEAALLRDLYAGTVELPAP
ncbi:MAG: DinB family protein [Jatrophihabitans sp.]